MDSRSAAHVLAQIASYLELSGANPFKTRAYERAARSLLAMGVDDLGPMLRSGELGRVRGLGPATVGVIRDLVETGESAYLRKLREAMPEGLLELMRVPGLSREKIHRLHTELGIASLDDLERAARDGRLTTVRGVGPRTAAKLLAGVEFVRKAGVLVLYHHAIVEAEALLGSVRAHPEVAEADIAGSLRRKREVIADIDIVAACTGNAERVAASFSRVAGVLAVTERGPGAVTLRFASGMRLDLSCVPRDSYGVALWRATGSTAHLDAVTECLAKRGIVVGADVLQRDGQSLRTPAESDVYVAAGLEWIAPELREGMGEVAAARCGGLPALIERGDIRGVLHCHTNYSDGKATVAQMATAARARGWDYLGISDHSQAAFYAAGVSRDRMLEQMDEIDVVNSTSQGFRVLKGVEADILADGRLDYDAELLDRFDFVIASIHSRFKMDGAAITQRVLRAMDDPHMTILAHPTGRLLLSRQPYDLDLDLVFARAVERGVAIEINADPHRLDLDWRHVKRARDAGVTFAIGPDAHSTRSLQWTDRGVDIARKGWLEPGHVLNTRDTDAVLEFARSRRR